MKAYSEMVKSELEAAIAEFGLENEVKEVAKSPNKPTNAEYVTVLERYEASEAPEVTEVEKIEEEQKAPAEVATKEEKIANMVEDLDTMVPVIVTDHDNTVTVEEDENRRVVSIRWGNPLIGMTTTNVAMHGMMQYLPKGAIIRLKKITLADHVKNADGKEQSKNDRRRFSVADTTGWTEAEFEAHAAEQRLKRV